jgi:hypothetical protein
VPRKKVLTSSVRKVEFESKKKEMMIERKHPTNPTRPK